MFRGEGRGGVRRRREERGEERRGEERRGKERRGKERRGEERRVGKNSWGCAIISCSRKTVTSY